MDSVYLKAYGKINLALDVVGVREDGYHELRMVMQTIGVYDELQLKRTRKSGIRVSTNLSFLPTDEHNLVYRAAKLLKEEFGVTDGLFVKLDKRIPVSAGLAGGSSDAATTLYGVNRLFRLGLDKRQLMERGATLGADIPYCVMRGTALAEGIGEKLTKLPPLTECTIVLAKPSESISTRFVYQNLQMDEHTVHPDVDRMIADLCARDLEAVAHGMGNVLETVTVPRHPVITQIKEQMMEGGALGSLMSGSGTSVFGLFTDAAAARNVATQLRRTHLAQQVFVTHPFNHR